MLAMESHTAGEVTLEQTTFRAQLHLDFFAYSEELHVVIFSENVFQIENLLYPPDISFSAFYVLYSVCWPPVGPQDIKT